MRVIDSLQVEKNRFWPPHFFNFRSAKVALQWADDLVKWFMNGPENSKEFMWYRGKFSKHSVKE